VGLGAHAKGRIDRPAVGQAGATFVLGYEPRHESLRELHRENARDDV
jgi:hypothetical protein